MLAINTSIFTLVFLAPQAIRNSRFQFNNSGINKLRALFFGTLKNEPRFTLLALCDITKFIFSLMTLSYTQSLSLWFFMIYTDGQLIFLLSKVGEFYQQKGEITESNLRIPQKQVVGFLFICTANLLNLLVFHNLANIFLVGYLLCSIAEYMILESSKSVEKVDWNNLSIIFIQGFKTQKGSIKN